jgi:hypothetical protein
MQSLGLQQIPNRTLETPENETEAQRLNRLMTQEVYGRDPQRVVGFLYQFAALVIFITAYEIKAGGIIWVVVLSIVAWLTIKGARAAAPNAVRTVLKARKFPILYLRPFAADNENVSNPIPFLWVRTPEKQFINLFRNRLRCPVVAVADPSEELGSLGAYRVWIDHDYWQEKVREFMRCAPLVLLAVGESSGSLGLEERSGSIWELQESVKLVDPTRLLILLPRKNRESIEVTLNRFLPKPVGTLWRKAQLLAFDSNWKPIEADHPQGVLARYHPVRKVSDSDAGSDIKFEEVDELVGPTLPEWQRILCMFANPTRTFEDIGRGNLRWWPPFLLIAGAWACLIFAIGSRGGWSQSAGDQAGFVQSMLVFVCPLFALIWICVASLVLKWTVNGLFGGGAAWNATFATWIYSSLPLAVALLLAAAMIRWLPAGTFGFTSFSSAELAAVVGSAGAHQAVLLVAALAVHLWFVILLSLGIAKIADVKLKSALICVIAWDLIYFAPGLWSWIATRGGSAPS